MGKMGYDIKVGELDSTELRFSRQAVQLYDSLKNTIWFGDLYRLISPYDENRAVLMYVDKAKSKAVLFDYDLHTRYKERFNQVRLQGLDPQKKYEVREVNLYPGTRSALPANGKTFSGDYLMKEGLDLSPRVKPLTSKVIEITAE